MGTYRLIFDRRAERELRDLTKSDRAGAKAVASLLDILRTHPSPGPPTGTDLTGFEGLRRLAKGDYRVVYGVPDGDEIPILRIGRRTDHTYKRLEVLQERLEALQDETRKQRQRLDEQETEAGQSRPDDEPHHDRDPVDDS